MNVVQKCGVYAIERQLTCCPTITTTCHVNSNTYACQHMHSARYILFNNGLHFISSQSTWCVKCVWRGVKTFQITKNNQILIGIEYRLYIKCMQHHNLHVNHYFVHCDRPLHCIAAHLWQPNWNIHILWANDYYNIQKQLQEFTMCSMLYPIQTPTWLNCSML